MTNIETDMDSRKISDVLLSLEEKVLTLIKAVSANDMNNKLILNNLNKLLSKQPTQVTTTTTNTIMPSVTADVPGHREPSRPSTLEISHQPPVVHKRQVITQPENNSIKELRQLTEKKLEQVQINVPKIPVGQRITDNKGKDLFMADVLITNIDTGEVINKSKTNAVGKWQTYLPIGKYSVHISKIIDSVTLNKIESLQEIEVTPQMKSLQLPIAIIKR